MTEPARLAGRPFLEKIAVYISLRKGYVVTLEIPMQKSKRRVENEGERETNTQTDKEKQR